ncbi:MAG TPA: LysR family transcriptional regulator [Woeseiaceae bacterium]|nr:LysR family transcriptional regulator [Woeseiaceae bacterium]
MKLRQLKYVVAIADNGLNVSAAAKRLYTSQPGISKQVKQLEEELGVEIFVRNGRTFRRVTPVGEEIIARARVIVREADAIHRLCRDATAFEQIAG